MFLSTPKDLGIARLGAALQGFLVCAELEAHVTLVGPVEEGSVGNIAQLGREVKDLIPVLQDPMTLKSRGPVP